MSLAKSFNGFFDINPMDIPSYSKEMWEIFAEHGKTNNVIYPMINNWFHYYDSFYLGQKEDPEGKLFKEKIGFEKSLLSEELIKWSFDFKCKNWYSGDKEVTRFGHKNKEFYANTQQRIKKQWWKLRDTLLEGINFKEIDSLSSSVKGLVYDEAFFSNLFYEVIYKFKDEKKWKEYQQYSVENDIDSGNSPLHYFRHLLLSRFSINEYNQKYKEGTAFLIWLIDNAVNSLDLKKVA